ncbi:MAG: hypothetical protein IJ715_03880 [Bacilli bacterium]|nr:hypothetical protein [Bacilli bacterium]
MKRIIKNPVMMYILGIITCTLTTVLASSLLANDITYKPKDKSWGVTNVQAAIDSLKLAKTSDNYSTDEHVVGTWIDGKPIYQKTIEFNNIAIGENTNYPHNIASIDKVIDYEFMFIHNSGAFQVGKNTISYMRDDEKLTNSVRVDRTNIIIAGTNKWDAMANRWWYFTIKYTKTTD